MGFDRAHLKPIEAEVEVKVGGRVSVEYAEPDGLVVGRNHGHSVDICGLQARLLNPYGIRRTSAVL